MNKILQGKIVINKRINKDSFKTNHFIFCHLVITFVNKNPILITDIRKLRKKTETCFLCDMKHFVHVTL